ncbi:MAG: presenilin [Nitrososphaerota archaeon]|jgi:presenilin-like A22 family membrane protease|nr:presenilin [Nitrososphaerota archaeon]
MTHPEEIPKQPQKDNVADKFKFQVVYLLPILASMLFGLVCSLVLLPQASLVIPEAPIPPETSGTDWGIAIYFVVFLAIGATVFYLLLKHKKRRIITGVIVLALTVAVLLLSLVFLAALTPYISFLNNWLVIILFAGAFAALFDLAIFRLGNKTRNIAVILMGGALGMFFGYIIIGGISFWCAILILVFLSVYDIFAVYKGPVGKIAQSSGLDQLPGLSFSFKEIQMGLGDLVFYSMLTGTMIFGFPQSFLPVIASMVGIIVGSVITFYMLEKKSIFPGLPFPIFLGLVFGLVVGFLLM